MACRDSPRQDCPCWPFLALRRLVPTAPAHRLWAHACSQGTYVLIICVTGPHSRCPDGRHSRVSVAPMQSAWCTTPSGAQRRTDQRGKCAGTSQLTRTGEKGLGLRDQRMKGGATCPGGANCTGARCPKAGEGNKGEERLVEAATSIMEPHTQWQNSVNV